MLKIGKDMPCTYLARHELQGIDIAIVIEVAAYYQLLLAEPAGLNAQVVAVISASCMVYCCLAAPTICMAVLKLAKQTHCHTRVAPHRVCLALLYCCR